LPPTSARHAAGDIRAAGDKDPSSTKDNRRQNHDIATFALAFDSRLQQIGHVPSTRTTPRAPYSLAPTDFPLPALATMAGQAPLGGPRELALACFVVCRTIAEASDKDAPLPADARRTRAQGMRHWLGAAAIPTNVRASLNKLVDAIATAERPQIADALHGVIAVTANRLDSAARLELARLAQGIAE
jgi:hypothetical protein